MLCPFYGLYTFFVPSGDGIILAGRYVYLAIQIIVSFFSLYIFREHRVEAIIITSLYMMCTRQNIPGLSYYNLYLTCCFVISIVLYGYLKQGQKRMLDFFIIGVCCSVAVLCMPYFAIIAFALLLVLIIKKRNKELIAYICSIMLCAFVYVAFLLSRASIADYINSIGYVLSNPDYADLSIVKKTVGTVLSLGKVCVVCVPGTLYLLVSKNERKKEICFTISLLAGIVLFGIRTPGAIFLQTSFLAFPYMIKLVFNGNLDTDQKAGVLLYFMGYAYAFLFWMGSDTEASCLPLGVQAAVNAAKANAIIS